MILAALIITSFFFNTYGYFSQTVVASVFWIEGYLIFPHIQKMRPIISKSIILLPVVAFLSYCNSPIGMYKNDYGNMILFYITASLGCLAILGISFNLTGEKTINLLGRNSDIVFSTHFFVKAVLIWAMIFIRKNVEYTVYPWYLVTFICMCVVEVLIVWGHECLKSKKNALCTLR